MVHYGEKLKELIEGKKASKTKIAAQLGVSSAAIRITSSISKYYTLV